MARGWNRWGRLGTSLLVAALGAGCATGADEDDPGGDASVDAAKPDATSDGAKPDVAAETTPDATPDSTVAEAATDAAADGPGDAIEASLPDADAAETNPCQGVVCNTPPASTCADATHLRVYSATGTCEAGSCLYTSSQTTCTAGCAAGKCNNDPCVGVTCNAPPKAFCSDATHLTVYVSPGSCTTSGGCTYTTVAQYCSFGCSAGVCNGDPCSGVSCTSPTANYCSGPNDLVVYDAKGTCAGGSCSYGSHTQYCTFGCASGACLNDPCAGVSCTTPTASYCSGANTLRTFSAPGTCNAGTCSYASADKSCVGGCVSGVCKDCSASAPCASGNWCNGSSCAACNSDQHCGASCADCTATGGVCNGTSCVQCVTDAHCGAGKWCNGGTCASCNTAAHCGSTCAACGGSTPLCDGSKCTCDATSCGAGATCNGTSCVTCNTTTACGPSCTVCSGATPICSGVATGCTCTTSPDSCGGVGTWCTSAGTCAACSAGGCGNGRCDCGETSGTCAADCGVPCPTAKVLATWDAADDGWVVSSSFWRRLSGAMVAGSGSNPYGGSYTENLTYNSDVNLASCGTATLKFTVRLADDPSYGSTDMSERLYVQCSGDAGATWTSVNPTPLSGTQSGCNTSYCAGASNDRSFGPIAGSISLPANCRTATARFRFQAKGASAWNMQNPAWYVDSVSLN